MLATHSRPGPTAAVRSWSSPPASAAQSIVRLDVAASGTSSYGCGVVVAPDGLIATNATLLANAQWIMVTTASGQREPATVVAVDPTSDVGLVSIDAQLPVARFVDWSELRPGAGAVMMAVSSVTTTAVWSDQTIASAGGPVRSGPGAGMASVVANGSTNASPDGAVLMEPDGAVIGILDKWGVASAAGGGTVFLPGEFVVQVAQELVADGGKIQHGWLGIKGANPSSTQPIGALVTGVDAAGAADDRLSPGDVIEAIDGRRVRSMADLRSRLYLLAPGTWVDLRVDRGHTLRTVGLSLSASA
jgi:S1-C subfamily serine protease